MLARCTRAFRDLETGELRMAGSTFEVTEDRLKAINSTRYGTLAEVVEEPKPKPRRTARRKEAEQQA